MLISQIVDGSDMIQVVARIDGATRVVNGAKSVYSLALEAARSGIGLAALIERKGFGKTVDLEAAYRQGRLISPINHPDAAHLHLTGTGLTHLGSAATRDAMHKKLERGRRGDADQFHEDVPHGSGRRQAEGRRRSACSPNGSTRATAPWRSRRARRLCRRHFAQDGGEEPEIAGIYVIGDDGTPFRVGFALSNEFSDHVTERMNYLYLAHSKLRNASYGPEILVGELPADIRGTSRIVRDGKTLWEKPFLSGEANMSHTIANLEHHHFKYAVFRQPGDVHIHMFGTATLSFADGIRTEAATCLRSVRPISACRCATR